MYGNGESVTIDRMVNHGIYDILITPDHCGECLISTDQLNATGHIVTMTTTETIIADVLHRYVLRYPRDPSDRDYPVPLDVLHQLSDLRKKHPLTKNAQDAMKKPYKIPHADKTESTRIRLAGATPQLSYVRSGRLRATPKTTTGRVIRLHKRMGHAPEDVMCMAVEPKKGKPLWRHTGVTAHDIRTVFEREP